MTTPCTTKADAREARSDRERALPQDRAFVVQLESGAAPAPEAFRGRVEHVTSGRATHFHTLEECLTFIGQTLMDTTNERRHP